MIEVQRMYKYGDNDRKFVSCDLKPYEYICYVRNVARKVIRGKCWMFCFVDVNPSSSLLYYFRKLGLEHTNLNDILY
jgi:hypothetical protein